MPVEHPKYSCVGPRKRRAFAFTLVEMLVVIGIIALLIALLLPSLGVARQMAQRTVCAAKLQQIMVAAQIHAIEHKGFYPIAGYIGNTDPEDEDDKYATRYDYFAYTPIGATRLLAPITMSLATEMSYGYVLNASDDATEAADETDSKGFIRHFLCPSQASSVDELPFESNPPMLYEGLYPGWIIWYTEGQSYIYNEAILGVDAGMGRCAGQQSLVRKPSQSMFAADGLGGSIYNLATRRSSYTIYPTGSPMFTVYNNVANPPVTLGDALTARRIRGLPVAGDPENFDLLRHRGKINIAFCDGHVETRNISAKDLASVYLLAP